MNRHIFSKNNLFVFVFLIISLIIPGGHTHASILNESEQKWLDQNVANISFAPEADFPPMIWNRYGALFGISHDYINYMQQLIDARFAVLKPRPLHDILDSFRATGETGIISSVTITPQRLEFLIFTRPYFSAPAIFVSTNNKPLTGGEIEQHKYSVVVGNGFGVHDYLADRYKDMKLVPVDNDFQVLQTILEHKADVGVLDVASLRYLIKENDISGINKVGDTGFVYNFSFAVPKNMPELRDILDEAIQAIPQSFSRSVLEKWGVDTVSMQSLVNSNIENGDGDDNHFVYWFIVAIILLVGIDFFLHKFLLQREEEKLKQDLKQEYFKD